MMLGYAPKAERCAIGHLAALQLAKGSVESTHKVPTSHYHTKHCHAAVVSLGGLTHG